MYCPHDMMDDGDLVLRPFQALVTLYSSSRREERVSEYGEGS